MAIHKLQKLGENASGDKAGVEIPREYLRLMGVMDQEGQLVEQPQVEIRREEDGGLVVKPIDVDEVIQSAREGPSSD